MIMRSFDEIVVTPFTLWFLGFDSPCMMFMTRCIFVSYDLVLERFSYSPECETVGLSALDPAWSLTIGQGPPRLPHECRPSSLHCATELPHTIWRRPWCETPF